MSGLLFGFGCWAALALPVLLSIAIVVNLHRGVIAGLLLNWLLVVCWLGGCHSSCFPCIEWTLST